jgi:hypothetical protein
VNEQTQSSEDQTILAVLDALGSRDSGRDSGEIPVLSSDETAETLARLYTEALGLLPYELDPVAPRPEVKDRLMAAVIGTGGTGVTGEQAVIREAPPAPAPAPLPVSAPSAPSAPPAPVVPLVPVIPLRPSQEVRVQRPAPAPAVRRSRWPLAIAATIAFLALGLSGLLFYGLLQQGEKIEQLTREKNAAEAKALQAAASEAESAEMERMREHLALVTSPAVEVSPMRPVGEAPSQPNARGVLYVKADHQHWYLALEGLEPAPPGKTYTLWFDADRPVSAGAFTAAPGAPVHLGSKQMPAGTKSVMVTLEDDPQAAAPEGPEILRAAAVYQIS